MEITDEMISTDYQSAINCLNQQQYREAVKLCRKILKHRPHDLRVINLLAICSHYRHKYTTAKKLFAIINQLSPNNPVYLNNQGSILNAQGDVDGAIAAYQQAIANSKLNFEAYLNLAKLHEQIGQPLHALNCYKQVLELDTNNVPVLLNSAVLLQKMHEQQAAIQLYEKILSLEANNAQALYGIATILQAIEQHTKAIEYYKKILEVNPKHIQSYINLGVAHKKNKNYEEAVNCYKAAIEIDPNLDYVYINLANALATLHGYEEAIDYYKKALALNSTSADGYSGLGSALSAMGDFVEAEKNFEQAIDIDLNHVDAHFNRAINFLKQGNFTLGWQEYEWRMRKPEMIFMLKKFPYPLWDGSPLGHKTLMILTEQGFKDNIQFIRYLPLIDKQQGKIILESLPELTRLFQQIPNIDQFNIRSDVLPNVNVFLPLLSLPLVMHTTLTNIPVSIPYLSAYEDDVEKAKKLFTLGDKVLRVGICWNTGPSPVNIDHAACSLEHFKILKQDKTHFYSLNKLVQSDFPSNDLPITDLTPYLDDFATTAAVLACLDLVISVDTGVAHLAGAMGKPVWNILSFNPDWRWLTERNDTPWYPTMRLYRQTKPHDWKTVFKQIKKDLKKFKPVK